MLDRVPAPPAEIGRHDGLAYARFDPPGAPRAGVLVLHGADSAKESHYDFARACRAAGMSALVVDLPGHGASLPPFDDRILEHLARAANLLPDVPLVLRGSSLGGYLALVAAGPLGARAVVAICPAPAAGLRRGLRDGRLGFRADLAALERFLERHELDPAVARLRGGLLLLHAEGDEVVPVEHSRALHAAAAAEPKRLIVLPGGHHRSIQHDAELQAVSLAFVRRALPAG